MKAVTILVPVLAALPSALAWGALGHETVAYIASNFVTSATKTYTQKMLADTSVDWLASVATWADTYRYTTAGKFSAPYHFIDANDNPPSSCSVDYDRDCDAAGCVVRAIDNYTTIVQDTSASAAARTEALKFVVHFIGDIHQPLHDEALDVGGNDIKVTFANDTTWNLHSVWDSAMIEKYAGSATLPHAKTLATTLSARISTGSYKTKAATWLNATDIDEVITTATGWASEANAFVCSTVMPDGISAVEDVDLAGEYYSTAMPVVEQLLAQSGYRLAAWLNLIATGSTGL